MCDDIFSMSVDARNDDVERGDHPPLSWRAESDGTSRSRSQRAQPNRERRIRACKGRTTRTIACGASEGPHTHARTASQNASYATGDGDPGNPNPPRSVFTATEDLNRSASRTPPGSMPDGSTSTHSRPHYDCSAPTNASPTPTAESHSSLKPAMPFAQQHYSLRRTF